MSIMDNLNKDITGPELDQPMSSGNYEPWELLPNREWLRAIIRDAKLQRVIMNGVIQYQYNEVEVDGVKVKEVIIDKETGKPVEQRSINIEYILLDFKTQTGKYRKAWAGFGASLGKKAKFNAYMALMGVPNIDAITPKPTSNQLINFLKGKHVWIQFGMFPTGTSGELAQKIVKEAVKLANPKHEYPVEPAAPTPQQVFNQLSSLPQPQHSTQPPGLQPAAQPAVQQPAPAPIQNPFAAFPTQAQPAAQPAADQPVAGWDD